MSTSEEQIPHVPRGAKKLNRDDLNRVIDVANQYNVTSNSPKSDRVSLDDGKNRNTLIAESKTTLPFETSKKYADTLQVQKGNWIRNEIKTPLESGGTNGGADDSYNSDVILIDTSKFTNAASVTGLLENTDYYVYIQLAANTDATTYSYDPTLIPGKLNLFVDRDKETAGIYTTDMVAGQTTASPTSRDFWIKDKTVIATVQVKDNGVGTFFINSVSQHITADVEDTQIVFDAENLIAIDDPGSAENSHARYTLEHNRYVDTLNPTGTIHYGETQIWEVNNCGGAGTSSVPLFQSSTTNNDVDGPAGSIKWGAIDAEYQPGGSASTFETIDVWIDQNTNNVPNDQAAWNGTLNNFSVVGLHGVTSANVSSYSMSYYDADADDGFGQTPGELKWAGIDSQLVGCDQKSLEVAVIDGTARFQVYDFDEPTTSTSTQGQTWGFASGNFTLLAREEGAAAASAVMKYMVPTTQDVVTNVTYTVGTGVLAMNKATLTVFSVTDLGASTITTAVDCD